MNGKMVENLFLFLIRLDSQNENLYTALINYVQQEKFIEKGQFRDHVVLMRVANNF